jgi:hypothetical protein
MCAHVAIFRSRVEGVLAAAGVHRDDRLRFCSFASNRSASRGGLANLIRLVALAEEGYATHQYVAAALLPRPDCA